MSKLDRITIRLDEDKKRRLAMLLARDNTTYKDFLNNYIEEYLERESTHSFRVKRAVKRVGVTGQRDNDSNSVNKSNDQLSKKRKPKRHGSGLI